MCSLGASSVLSPQVQRGQSHLGNISWVQEMLRYVGSGLDLKLEGMVSSGPESALELGRIRESFGLIQRSAKFF